MIKIFLSSTLLLVLAGLAFDGICAEGDENSTHETHDELELASDLLKFLDGKW